MGHGPSPSSSTPGAEKREKQYRAHQGFGDHHGGVTGAHTYFYADEAKCDQHMETFLRCIDASSECSRVLDSPTVLGTARISQSHNHHTSPAQRLMVRLTLSLWFHPGGSSEDGFSAIKLTALARPQFLVSARAVTECGGAEPGPQMMLLLGQVPYGISNNGSEEWAPRACPLRAQDP